MLARLGSRLGHARRGPARGLLLEIVAFDADTAARGVSERLLGLAGETVEPNTVNEEQSGYCERASLSAYGQRALTPKRTLWGGGALEQGHGTPLEPLAQLGDALCSIGALAAVVDAAELVIAQAATGKSVNGH